MSNRRQFSVRWLLGLVAVVAVPLSVCAAFINCYDKAKRSAAESAAQHSINSVQSALRGYHNDHGHYPPGYIADANGKPMHSWRVLILPYLGYDLQYEKYDFSEPWDGPNNSQIFDEMPELFNSATEPLSTRYTNIVLIVGPGTAFPDDQTTSYFDMEDGLENTILLTEITDSKIIWTQPIDIDARKPNLLSHDSQSIGVSSVHWRKPKVAFADGITAYSISRETPPKKLKALITIAGGEATTRDELIEAGYLQ